MQDKGLGMSNSFKLNSNGKELSYEQFIAKLLSGEFQRTDNKFWQFLVNVYDTDGNGKIDIKQNANGKSEAGSVFDALKQAAGEDCSLDNKEIGKLAKYNFKGIKFGKKKLTSLIVAASNLLTSIADSVKSVSLEDCTKEATEYTQEEIQDISIQTLSDDSKTARKVFDNQINHQGEVSDFVNDVKETFNTEYAASRINRFISEEELCANLLQQAKDGTLTQKSYLEQKLVLAKSLLPPVKEGSTLDDVAYLLLPFIGNISLAALGISLNLKEKMSDERKLQEIKIQILENALKSLSLDELNALIANCVNVENEEAQNVILENVLSKYFAHFNISYNTTDMTNKTLIGFKETYKLTEIQMPTVHTRQLNIEQVSDVNTNNSVGSLMVSEPNKLKSFKETFYDERGVEYNPKKVMDYTRKNAQMQFVVWAYNRIASLQKSLNNTQVGLGAADAQKMNADVLYSEKVVGLNIAIVQALVFLKQGAKNEIEKTLSDVCGRDIQLSELTFNDMKTYQSLLSSSECKLVVKYLNDYLNGKMTQILNGKTLEQYAEETNATYREAYGDRNVQELANRFVESQKEGVQIVKTTVQSGAAVVMIAGQLLPVGGQLAAAMTIGGLAASTLGGTTISAIENCTKAGGPTEEDKQEMFKELVTIIALVSAGFGSGKISEAAFRMLIIKNSPKLLAYVSELGLDTTMSLVADYAITGEIDLSGEGIAQLQSILVGLAHAKGNFKTYLNAHASNVVTQKSLVSSAKPKNIHRFNFDKIKQDLGSNLKDKVTLSDMNAIFKYFLEHDKEFMDVLDSNKKYEKCERYAKTFELLCNELGIKGIECKKGKYTDTNGKLEKHMWNEIEINGQRYIYDAAQRQAFEKGWSPNPALKSGYEEQDVISPKATKRKPDDVANTAEINFEINALKNANAIKYAEIRRKMDSLSDSKSKEELLSNYLASLIDSIKDKSMKKHFEELYLSANCNENEVLLYKFCEEMTSDNLGDIYKYLKNNVVGNTNCLDNLELLHKNRISLNQILYSDNGKIRNLFELFNFSDNKLSDNRMQFIKEFLGKYKSLENFHTQYPNIISINKKFTSQKLSFISCRYDTQVSYKDKTQDIASLFKTWETKASTRVEDECDIITSKSLDAELGKHDDYSTLKLAAVKNNVISKNLLNIDAWDGFITVHSRTRFLERYVEGIIGYKLETLTEEQLRECLSDFKNTIANIKQLNIIPYEESAGVLQPTIYVQTKGFYLEIGFDPNGNVKTLYDVTKKINKMQNSDFNPQLSR